MAREFFQFLGKAGELPEADSMSASFMKGHPPDKVFLDTGIFTYSNDFQRMFRC